MIRDYFELGASPDTCQKLIVQWESFEEGYLFGDSLAADLAGTLQPVRGAMPRYWRGTIQADDSGIWPDDYYTVQNLMAVCVRSPMLWLVNQFGEGPFPVLWLGDFTPNWVNPAARQAEIPFTFVEVLT